MLRRLVARLTAVVRPTRRWRAPADAETPRTPVVDDVRRRLELVLTALYERPFRVEAAPEPRRPSWIWRLLGAQPPAPPLATHLGDTIRLPRTLPLAAPEAALARWRLLALEQAERMVRGSGALAADVADPLERTLFALGEGACVDRSLGTRTRGAAAELGAVRAAALAVRPPLPMLPAAERDVERLIQAVLATDAATPDAAAPNVPAPNDPAPDARAAAGGLALPDPAGDAAASLAWARATAARLRAVHGDVFRRVLPVAHWGELPEVGTTDGERVRDAQLPLPSISLPGLQTERESRTARVPHDEQPPSDAGAARAPTDAPPRPDAPAGLVLAAADDPWMPGAPEHRPDTSPPPPDDVPLGPATATPRAGDVARIGYPEWDAAAGRYRPHGATVVLARAPEGDGAWAEGILRDHATLVRRVRDRFAPLRARRARLPRQPAGEELDVAACVDAYVDRRAGRPGDERLYVAVRPARRALAIAIVVDVSGSTDAPVSARGGETRQIIDVEKEALVLASEALEALGDPFTVLTFSSRGSHAVRVTTIKDFTERADATVHRRIAAMRPVGNTRLGAALRHATALLTRQPVGHRLLLLLSDGRPNDADGYQGPYATEDARQAVFEARASGVHPYCLTVDREEADYLPHIFGVGGHTLLRDVEQLPLALIGAVRQLLGATR